MADLRERINNLMQDVTSNKTGAISDRDRMIATSISSNKNLDDMIVANVMKEVQELKGVISDREMQILNQSQSARELQRNMQLIKQNLRDSGRMLSDTDKAIGKSQTQGIARFQEGGMAEMSQEEGMAEIQMSKEQAMQEIFMPLVEAGFEAEVMAILNNPLNSEISRQAVERLIQVLSQEPDFDIDDFMMAVSLVAPQ